MLPDCTENFTVLAVLLAWGCAPSETGPDAPIVLSDDGGWCWFQDERAIVVEDTLIVGTVATGTRDEGRRGDIEVITYDLESGQRTVTDLSDHLQTDDHDSPVFAAFPDGSLLTLFSRHGNDNRIHHRRAESPTGPWGPLQIFVPSESSRITYSNLHVLASEGYRVYDFFRGLDGEWKPSYAYSDDRGRSWTSGSILIRVPSDQRHRPYVRYASNGVDTIHLSYTEGHPRDYDNSVYHVFYRDGFLHRSDGDRIASLEDGLDSPDQGTRVFQGSPDRVPWTTDIGLDSDGHPVVVYSVQMDSAGLPPGQGGEDHRYRYARWDGTRWRDHSLAYAGTRLYAGEDDYTGLATLDPDDPDVVFISTDADPVTGEPLISDSDGRRHYEIFRGTTGDGGISWAWASITEDSTSDNLRPIVPAWSKERTALLWLRGSYRSYTDYDLDVVLLLDPRSP